jgi:type I restriction enzyme, S subunit
MSRYQPYPSYKDSGDEWLGEVPDHWEVKKLKYHARIKNGQDQKEVLSDDGKYPIFGSGGKFGRASRYLYNKTSVLLGRKGTIDKPLYIVEPFWTVDTMYYTQIAQNIFSKFFFYSCLTIKFDFYQFGAAIPSMTQENLHNIFFATPSFEEQTAIANFLDIQTAKIDTLIAKQQRMIELLGEKRSALISHAVTKGLNPDVAMKDSGVEWFGDVPAVWIVAGFKKYLDSIVDYRGKTPEKVDSGIFLVTARNIKKGTINYDASQEYVNLSDYDEIMSRGVPNIGDVLFTTEAPLGEVANIDRTDIALAQRIIKFSGKKGIIDNYFLKYFMLSASFQNSLMIFATGSTALGIKAERFVYLRQLIPPYQEQIEITQHIDTQTTKIDALIAKSCQAIDLMKERRTALISAAVTGKIDVRGIV